MDMKEPIVDPGENATATGAADPPNDRGAAALMLEAVTAERDRLLEEKNELVELLRRRQAEFDNFRKRAEREKSEVLEFAHSDSVRAILPILDDFERARNGADLPASCGRAKEVGIRDDYNEGAEVRSPRSSCRRHGGNWRR